MIIVWVYLVIINIVAYSLFGYDKSKAKRGQRRVPEKSLFTVAAVGGAAGAWLGMRSFRHKTKHASFTFGIPALFIVNVLCVYYIGKTFF